jgi:NTP pyrophosphatase (non-canonical NTP hydrolase)
MQNVIPSEGVRKARKTSFDYEQREIGEWGDSIHMGDNPRAIILHTKEETQELLDEWDIWADGGGNAGEVEKECADVVILMTAFAHACGFSLYDAIQEKMEINRARKQGPPDKDGIVHHVKE